MPKVKIVLGVVMIAAAAAELLRVVRLYQVQDYQNWPFGVEIGVAVIGGLGAWLIRRGLRERADRK
ncbi:MAG: hypothetical protein WBA12_00165 [Catalinimonas sp.]